MTPRISLCLLALACLASPSPAAAPPSAADARARVLALADARRFDASALSTLARHEDAGVRVAVAGALGELGNVDAVPLLVSLAHDADGAVRAAAAEGSARLASMLPGRDAARAALGKELRALLQDKVAEVRAAAAWGAGMALLPGSDLWLLQRLALERSPAVQAAILQELWRFPGALWIKRATTYTGARDRDVRLAATWSLARSGRSEAVAGLKRAARDPDPLVRMTALEGARRGKGAALLEDLLAATADADARVRIAAFQGLAAVVEREPGRVLPPSALELVRKEAADTDPTRVQERVAAIRLAGAAGCCREPLGAAVSAGEPWVAGEALVALARLGDEPAERTVREWFASTDLPRRLAAVRAFRFVAGGQQQLLAALADSRAEVRLAAVEALGEDTSASTTAAIDGRLADADPIVRAAAVEALAARKALPGPEDLLRLLGREHGAVSPDAAVAIVEALAQGRELSTAVCGALEGLASSPDPVVARAAWSALARAGTMVALPEVRTGEPAAFYRQVEDWGGTPRWLEVVTVRGTMQIVLDTATAPLTCYRLAALAGKKFFDGLTFHRVEPDFVVQGGDPRGDGWGGPGYVVRDELALVPFGAGAVGIALAGPDTGGSQFFITLTPRPHLLGRYPHLGSVAAGEDVAQRLRVGDKILRVSAGEGPPPTFYPVWYGVLSPERLAKEIAGWQAERAAYVPKEKWLALLRTAKVRYALTVAMGTWCSDSREQIPRLQAVLQALGPHSPFDPPRLVGLDRSKSVDAKLFPYGPVELVPTIVVTAGGSEVGRIVETPKSGSIEEDLVRILAPIEGWELPNG
jgi:cyclophilin family peptidyl-prolyl cis-trans isomerase/HEAT repeat protein